jgi:hypothetical protein
MLRPRSENHIQFNMILEFGNVPFDVLARANMESLDPKPTPNGLGSLAPTQKL